MKKALLLLSLLFFTQPTYAEVHIQGPWSRATNSAMMAGATYFTLKSDVEDALIRAESPVAKRVEVHSVSTNEHGVMIMDEMEEVRLPANVEVMFAPGGYHIMLMGLHQPLEEGFEYPLTLHFKNSPKQNIRVTIKSANHQPENSHNHGSHHHH